MGAAGCYNRRAGVKELCEGRSAGQGEVKSKVFGGEDEA